MNRRSVSNSNERYQNFMSTPYFNVEYDRKPFRLEPCLARRTSFRGGASVDVSTLQQLRFWPCSAAVDSYVFGDINLFFRSSSFGARRQMVANVQEQDYGSNAACMFPDLPSCFCRSHRLPLSRRRHSVGACRHRLQARESTPVRRGRNVHSHVATTKTSSWLKHVQKREKRCGRGLVGERWPGNGQ